MIVRILFESLWLLVGVWAGVQLVIVGVWSWRRTPRSARNVWFGLAALPVLIVMSLQVVTLRERIVHLCLEMADNVENGNVTEIERRLSDDFEAQGLDRTAFVARLDETLARHRVNEVTLRRLVVTVAKRNLVIVEVHATCLLRSPDLPYERFVSDWRLHFALCGIRWKLKSIERLPASSRLMDQLAKSRGE